VPLSDAAASVVAIEPEAIEKMLSGGDDYEIVCTVSPDRLDAFRAAAEAAHVPVTAIGRVMAVKAPPRFVMGDGKRLHFKQASFSHF
jgi:thiamine-monophosphate kinase